MANWLVLRRWKKQHNWASTTDPYKLHQWALLQIGLSQRAANILRGKRAMYLGVAETSLHELEKEGLPPYFSFCTTHWESAGLMVHCWNCDDCVTINQHWHCGYCNVCWPDAQMPCNNCGGKSKLLGGWERQQTTLAIERET